MNQIDPMTGTPIMPTQANVQGSSKPVFSPIQSQNATGMFNTPMQRQQAMPASVPLPAYQVSANSGGPMQTNLDEKKTKLNNLKDKIYLNRLQNESDSLTMVNRGKDLDASLIYNNAARNGKGYLGGDTYEDIMGSKGASPDNITKNINAINLINRGTFPQFKNQYKKEIKSEQARGSQISEDYQLTQGEMDYLPGNQKTTKYSYE